MNTVKGYTSSCIRPTQRHNIKRIYKGDLISGKWRAYLLLFYNLEKAAKDQIEMNEYLTSLHNLENRTLKEYRMKNYDRYLEATNTPKRGRKIKPSQEQYIK